VHTYLQPPKFHEYVAGSRQRLALARIGTRVVTYHSPRGCVHRASAWLARIRKRYESRRFRAEGDSSLQLQMRRHQWAAARLWEGLIGPSNEMWSQGTGFLATTELVRPTPVPGP